MTRPRRLLGLVVGAIVLTACRLDVDVSTTVDADGTGDVIVVGVIDKDVVDRVPGLASRAAHLRQEMDERRLEARTWTRTHAAAG